MGTRAHAWQGKAEMELGNVDLAQDIFDEVLVHVPEKNEKLDRVALKNSRRWRACTP